MPKSKLEEPESTLGEEEKKHRLRPHIPAKLASHGPFKHLQKGLDCPASAASENLEPLSMPTPWTSASTATRAEPRVLHGYTLTKEVPFREVCTAIKDAAFVNR